MDEKEGTKIIFKPLQYNKNAFNSKSLKSSLNDYIILFNTNNIYNYLESCFPPRILNIKLCFYSFLQKENKENNLSVSLDCITFYEYKDNHYILLNDSDEFEEEIDNNENIIYYNFNQNKINIRIDFFSYKIDHFFFNLSEMCSIFMLKYLIYLKLKNIEAINNYKALTIKGEQNNNDEKEEEKIISNNHTDNNYLIKINEIENVIKLYGNGIISNKYQGYKSKDETNRNFLNNTLLLNALNYYLSFSRKNNNNLIKKSKQINININKDIISILNNNSKYTLSFIMTECKKDKIVLGLDFRFNLLNYFSPYYIENDKKSAFMPQKKKFLNKSKIILYNGGGMKLFVFCKNQKCIYNSKYFVYHLGYGYFDIFKAMSNIYCPLCKKKGKKIIEIRYIGMMNAKWVYKGFLSGLKYSNVEGQGITILNDIIYRTNEILFAQQFISLSFQIKKYYSNNTIVKEEKPKKYTTTINTTYFTDNSFFSNISEEDEKKNLNIDKVKKNEVNETISINLIKNKINRIERKKFRNRNRNNNNIFEQSKNSWKTTNINNNSKCDFSDFAINKKKESSCWETCTNENKDEDNCLIF